MHPDNDRFRDFLGVTAWHKAGYTGKRGLTASAETFNGGHGYQTYKAFKEFAPDREVTTLPMDSVDGAGGFYSKFIDEGIPTILNRRVDTMWGSISLSKSGVVYDQPLEPTLPFFTFFMSSGNDGTNAYNRTLDSKYIYGVGAYRLMFGTNEIVPEGYSSITDKVDFCGPAYIWIDGVPFSGSSCGTPVVTGMAALVNDLAIDQTGEPLSSRMMYQFFVDHRIDLKATGKDAKTGWGAPILPPPETVDIEKYREETVMEFKDDSKISAWAKEDVEYITNLGLMKGTEAGNFNPKGPITREELAVVIARLHRTLSV